MKPCDGCGMPVENDVSLCDGCGHDRGIWRMRDPVANAGPADGDHAPSKAKSHWAWCFVGGLLNGIPAAILMGLASQAVTSFRMPVLTSCGLGLGVLMAFGLFGGLVDVLSGGRANSDRAA